MNISPDNADKYRELQLLQELAEDPETSQRQLSKQLGVALGLTNLMIDRLAKKGWIELSKISKNKLRYLLTPEGIAEKTRLTCEYLEYSMFLYKGARQVLREALQEAAEAGDQDVLIFGTGELAEIAYLTTQELGLNPVAFVDESNKKEFLGVPVRSLDELSSIAFDCAVASAIHNDVSALTQRFHALNIAIDCLIVLEQTGTDMNFRIQRASEEEALSGVANE